MEVMTRKELVRKINAQAEKVRIAKGQFFEISKNTLGQYILSYIDECGEDVSARKEKLLAENLYKKIVEAVDPAIVYAYIGRESWKL